ncbi:MAG: hypothetical protein ABI415_09495 [Flavitalea sp.]
MEDDFINCPHCNTLNFREQRKCSSCSFRLPLNPDKQNDKVQQWNAVFIRIVIVFLVAMMVLAFTVRVYK